MNLKTIYGQHDSFIINLTGRTPLPLNRIGTGASSLPLVEVVDLDLNLYD